MKCPDVNVCCPAGTTCARDVAGNAICQDSTPNPSPNPNPNPDPDSVTVTNNNNNNNNKTTKNDASLPQVVAAWGLMVTVALLSAFLVSPLTV